MADTVKTLKVELTAGTAGFQRGFAQAASATQKLSGQLGGLRASLTAGFGAVTSVMAPVVAGITAVGGAFALAAKHTLDYADAFVDLSTRSGHTVEWLQATKFAAEQSGISLEEVTSASEKLRKALGEGTEKTTEAVRALGLSFRDLRESSPDEQMDKVLRALAGVTDTTARTTIAMQLFGKSGGALLAMAGDFETLKARAEELGIVISEKNVRAAEALGDGIGALTTVFGGLVNNLGTTITSSAAVHEVLGIVTEAFAELSRWVAANTDAIRGFISGGLQLLAGWISGVISAIQLLVHGWYALQDGALAVVSTMDRLALTFRMLKEVMANPLQAKAIFADYQRELGRVSEAQKIASESVARDRAKADKAFAAGQGVIVKVTDALQRLGSAEVEVGKSGARGAGGLTEIGNAAEQAAEQAAKLLAELSGKAAQEKVDELARAFSVLGVEGVADLEALRKKLEQLEQQGARITDAGLLGVLRGGKIEIPTLPDNLDLGIDLPDWGPQLSAALLPAQQSFDAIAQAASAAGLSTAEIRVALEGAGASGVVLERALASVPVTFGSALKQTLAGLPQVILGAIQGGGDVGKSIGSYLGGSIMEGLAGENGPLGKGLSSLLGKTLGGAISSILPGLGSIIGAGLGSLVGKVGKAIGNLFGGKEKEVNKLRNSFIESQGGLDALRRKAAEAGVSLDKLFAARDSKKGLQAAIDEITGKLDNWDRAQEAVNEAAERYGLTIEELGPAFARQQLDEQAAQLLQDYRVLQASGADMNAVIAKMAPNFSTFVQQALAAGQAIPMAMKPMVDQLIQSGQLLDANGNAFTSAEAAGITFTETLTEGLSRAVTAIEALVAALTGVPPVTIPVNYQVGPGPTNGPPGEPGVPQVVPGEIPAMARGGIVTMPTMALIGEAGPEAVVPLERAAGGRGLFGSSTVVNITAPINENPLATFEGLRRQREFTVREIRRQVERNLPAAIAAGLA